MLESGSDFSKTHLPTQIFHFSFYPLHDLSYQPLSHSSDRILQISNIIFLSSFPVNQFLSHPVHLCNLYIFLSEYLSVSKMLRSFEVIKQESPFFGTPCSICKCDVSIKDTHIILYQMCWYPSHNKIGNRG